MDSRHIYSGENTLERCVSECEREVILHALRRASGNLADAAQMLGATKRGLARKIRKYDIDRRQFETT